MASDMLTWSNMPDFFQDTLASHELRRMESLWWFNADCHGYNCIQVPLAQYQETSKSFWKYGSTALALVTKWCPSSFLAFSRRSHYILESSTLVRIKKQSELSTQWGGQPFPSTSTGQNSVSPKSVMPLGFFGRSNCDIAFDTCATQRGRNHL